MQPKRQSWDEYFMLMAVHAASRSTCLSNSVGAVIAQGRSVISTGYNGVPSGLAHCTEAGFCFISDSEIVEKCSQSDRPSPAIHAEANAIGQAAQSGVSTKGATIYTTYQPCVNCLKYIISAGIVEIVYSQRNEATERAIEWGWIKYNGVMRQI